MCVYSGSSQYGTDLKCTETKRSRFGRIKRCAGICSRTDPTGGEKALRDAGEDDIILAFGSLSYLGQVKEAVYQRADRAKKAFNRR